MEEPFDMQYNVWEGQHLDDISVHVKKHNQRELQKKKNKTNNFHPPVV